MSSRCFMLSVLYLTILSSFDQGLVQQCWSTPMVSFGVFESIYIKTVFFHGGRLLSHWSWNSVKAGYICGVVKDILDIFWIPYFVAFLSSNHWIMPWKEKADLVEDTFLFNDLVGWAFQTSWVSRRWSWVSNSVNLQMLEPIYIKHVASLGSPWNLICFYTYRN